MPAYLSRPSKMETGMDEIVRAMMEEKDAARQQKQVVEEPLDFYAMVKAGNRVTRVTPPIDEGSKFSTYDFNDLCPWEEVLCSINGITRRESMTAVRAMPLRLGHMYHGMIQNDMFPNQEIRIRERKAGSRARTEVIGGGSIWLGWWKCEWCSAVTKGEGPMPYDTWIPKPLVCPVCDVNSTFRFEEPEHERGMFLSHSDGGVLWNGDKIHVELKSCSGENFHGTYSGSGLKRRPDENHVIQTYINQYTSRIRRSIIVYMNKAAKSGSEMFATHTVLYNEEVVRQLNIKAQAILQGIRYKALPRGDDWRACGDCDDDRAKACAAREFCPVTRPELAKDVDFFLVSDDVSRFVAV